MSLVLDIPFSMNYRIIILLPHASLIQCTACFWALPRNSKVLMANDYLNQENLQTIQKRENSFKCPPNIGRIPHKIMSRFSGLKADQWKSWTMHFSLYCLKDILPQQDYNCWHKFVKA